MKHLHNDALRSDIFDGFECRCYREGPPHMSTDTSTLPRRALLEGDDSATLPVESRR
jgi:hypothetical protein